MTEQTKHNIASFINGVVIAIAAMMIALAISGCQSVPSTPAQSYSTDASIEEQLADAYADGYADGSEDTCYTLTANADLCR